MTASRSVHIRHNRLTEGQYQAVYKSCMDLSSGSLDNYPDHVYISLNYLKPLPVT